MLQLQRSRLGGMALGSLALFACATGLDVSDEELAEICADPNLDCDGAGPSQGGSTGLGGSNSGIGGTLSNVGGTGSPPGNGGNPPINVGNQGGSANNTLGGSGGTNTAGTGNTGPITGGNCADVVPPIATGTCAAAPTVTITYTDGSNGASSQEMKMDLGLEATSPVNLPDVVIRYWFTANGQSDFQGTIDYASLGDGSDIKGSLCVAFGDQLGTQFADIAFTGGGSASSVQTIQVRMNTSGYAQLDQSDDFSYVAGGADAPNPNISVYAAGQLIGGCEPGGT